MHRGGFWLPEFQPQISMIAFRFFVRPYLVAGLLASALITGCDKNNSSSTSNPNVDYYTCTMHPSVHSHDPKAKCPICSMDLEPVMKKGAGHGPPVQASSAPAVVDPEFHDFTVPITRQQQIGVTFAEVKREPLRRTIRAAGTVAMDQKRRWEYVARIEGYVEKLDVTSPGEPVKKDQALLSIYSPDLFVTQRELINQLNARDRETTAEGRSHNATLIESSRRRLEQWNITASQIAELEKTRKAPEFLTLHSPFDGVVEDVPVQQGRKVMPGDRMVNVVDLSLVWVWAEFYEEELPLLAQGLKAVVTTPSYPGERFEGQIALVSPFVANTMRTAKVRLDIPNPGYRLRPGMFVTVELALDHGTALAIPVSAVMPTGERTLVFVDKGEGKLEPRAIQLGGQYGDHYELHNGLKEGERVVDSANFLIDAESKVQGAVKSFEEHAPEGPAKMAATPEVNPLPAEARALYAPFMASYLAVERLLNQDNLEGLTSAVTQLRDQVRAIGKSGVLPANRADIYQRDVSNLDTELGQFKTAALGDARISFGKVSAALIALLTEFPPPLESTIYVMNCPMWEKSPADWVQSNDVIANPFMGAKMSGCGDVVKTLLPNK